MTTFFPAGGSSYYLNSSISSTDTTITLASFTTPVTGTPWTIAIFNSSIMYGTIGPKTSSSEFISFTGITQNSDGTAILTGVTRGLNKSYPYTSDVTFKLPHSGQSIFILSDVPQVFFQYPAKNNAETVPGDWTFTGNVTFSNFPVTPSNSDASTTVKGVTKLSVAPVLSTNPIATGTNDPRIPVAYAVDSVGTDAYAITPSPAITAYTAGQVFSFKAGTANTGAATLNVNALGAKTIKKNVTDDLITGDILIGEIVIVVYDGTNMQLQTRVQTVSPTIQTFTASGTYTKPAGLSYAIVEVQGSGGSAATGDSNGAAGGGGGAYSKKIITASSIGTSETVTIGAAAVGSGNTSFGALLIAPNGGSASSFTGGTGGVASGGNLNINGESGQSVSNGVMSAGSGGSSFMGVGGSAGNGITSTGTSLDGKNGQGYGAGGGAAMSATDGIPTGTSGTGTGGIIIVTEYYS